VAGHVTLDVECLDRVYPNGYLPNLQSGRPGRDVLVRAGGCEVPSPVLFNKIGLAFRRAVMSFATEQHIPVVRFAKGDRKADVMRPLPCRLPRADPVRRTPSTCAGSSPGGRSTTCGCSLFAELTSSASRSRAGVAIGDQRAARL